MVEEGFGVGLVAAEFFVEGHCIFSVAGFKDVGFVVGGSVHVERTFFHESLPSVGFKHLCPEVSLVAASVFVAAENVFKVRTSVAIFNH